MIPNRYIVLCTSCHGAIDLRYAEQTGAKYWHLYCLLEEMEVEDAIAQDTEALRRSGTDPAG